MQSKQKIKAQIKSRRKARIRSKIFGRSSRPRLSVFRSLNHLYAQIINDETGTTLVAVSDYDIKAAGKKTKTEIAVQIGEVLAKKAAEKKITAVVFDRGGDRFHGRIKAVADGARKGGLQF